MTKVVIGLVARQGAGKGYFVKNLNEVLKDRLLHHVKSGGVLVDILKILKKPVTRENLQNLAGSLRTGFGPDIIAEAIYGRIMDSHGDVVVFDAVRWKSDEEVIRRFPRGILVYIDTDKEIRYQRLRDRGEKENEKGLSREDFEKSELASTEVEIGDIATRADCTLSNNGTEEEFFETVRQFRWKYMSR